MARFKNPAALPANHGRWLPTQCKKRCSNQPHRLAPIRNSCRKPFAWRLL